MAGELNAGKNPIPGASGASVLDQIPTWAMITAGAAVTIGVAGIAYAVAKSGEDEVKLGRSSFYEDEDDLARRKAQIRRRMAELQRKYG